jgi:hypothetical protein
VAGFHPHTSQPKRGANLVPLHTNAVATPPGKRCAVHSENDGGISPSVLEAFEVFEVPSHTKPLGKTELRKLLLFLSPSVCLRPDG